jgi:hypothetical protein
MLDGQDELDQHDPQHESNDPMGHIDMTGIGHDVDGLDDFTEGIGIGGHATNLDGLDKDEIMKMMDQEVDGLISDDGLNADRLIDSMNRGRKKSKK